MEKTTIADRITSYLASVGYDKTPVEIAFALNLNEHSVRRTTREMFLAGELVAKTRYRGAPAYVLALIATT